MNKIDLDISNYSIRLYHSNIHISTIDAFSNIDLDSQIQNLNQSINLNIKSWKGRIKNDFEKVDHCKKIINPTEVETLSHKDFLKKELKKNFY